MENKKMFEMRKIAAAQVISGVELMAGQVGTQALEDELMAVLQGYVYENLVEERDLKYYTEPPSFWDWLFRRRKMVVFNLKIKDLLIDAPKHYKNAKTCRIYLTELNNYSENDDIIL